MPHIHKIWQIAVESPSYKTQHNYFVHVILLLLLVQFNPLLSIWHDNITSFIYATAVFVNMAFTSKITISINQFPNSKVCCCYYFLYRQKIYRVVPAVSRDDNAGNAERLLRCQLSSRISLTVAPPRPFKTRCSVWIRYDTIEEINVDSKAEYTA